MLKSKKKKTQIEEEIKKLKKLKEELLFIKNNLDDKSPKVDISDVYIWEVDSIYNIVKLQEEKIVGYRVGGFGRKVSGYKGYKSILIDIFTNKEIYRKENIDKIGDREPCRVNGRVEWSFFYPIYKAEPALLAYVDKKVPLYVLQQVYYKLNNVNLGSNVLKKQK